jgi:hypothetical protein
MFKTLMLWLRKRRARANPRPLNSLQGYRCSACKEWSSSEEWSDNWDWSGPSCPKCGAGGMEQFSNVIEQETPGIWRARR